MLQKTNIPGYFKDSETRVVINRNLDELTRYRQARQKLTELNNVNEKVDKLTADVNDIKNMLSQLLAQKAE